MTRFIMVMGVAVLATNVAYAQKNYCPTDCDRTDIEALVCSLKTDRSGHYDPSPHNGYSSPTCSSTKVDPTPIGDAFSFAPLGLRKCLCSLTKIFIHKDANIASWGKWENPHYSIGTGKKARSGSDQSFIALHSNDFVTVSAHQDSYLLALNIQKNVAQHKPTRDSALLGTLYALAHEMGHITWRRDYSTSPCDIDTFWNYSWTNQTGSDAKTAAQTWRWTKARELSFGTRKNSMTYPDGANQTTLTHIYGDATGFTTAFGAANPEEDFAEAYAMTAVTKANPGFLLQIQIGGNFQNVNTGRGAIQSKFDCVSPLL